MESANSGVDAPYLLGIESSGTTCGVCLSSGAEVIVEVRAEITHVHSRMLAPFVDTVLEAAGLQVRELSAIVLSSGPGSFTGLRIGYAIAKGLAHIPRLPIVEVPTLDIWAHQALPSEKNVVSLIDAHRQEFFAALYEPRGDSLVRKSDFRIVPLAELKEMIRKPALLVGDAVPKYEDNLLKLHIPEVELDSRHSQKLDLSVLMKLGYQSYRRADVSDPANCEPMYLRKFKGVS